VSSSTQVARPQMILADRPLTWENRVSEERVYPNPNACSPVNSQLGAGRDRRGPVDPADDDWMGGPTRTDRGNGRLPPHASAGGVPRTARPGRGAGSAVGGGMIVATSTALLADSRVGERPGRLGVRAVSPLRQSSAGHALSGRSARVRARLPRPRRHGASGRGVAPVRGHQVRAGVRAPR
jgi:hypothetical protein